MKKSTYLTGALFALMAVAPMSLNAEDIASASTDVYDFSGWDSRGILELFVNAADKGRNYPTAEEFAAKGIYLDLEFARSHVRYQPILTQSADENLYSDVYPTRRIWMNLPTGSPKVTGGYPSSEFDSDAYTMWNYTHIFGSWNHGFMQAPGCWASAAHKNGTYLYSGIEFFDTTGGDTGDGAKFSNYVSKMNTKNEDGSFKYVDAMLNALIFLGQDGINYNFEAGLPSNLAEFHAALYERAKKIGFDSFHIGGYTTYSYLTATNVGYMLGNSTYGKVMDAFLNYSGNDFGYSSVPNSLSIAKANMGTAEDVYQGVWIVTMDRSWIQMNQSTTKEMNLCLWGEHAISRFFQYNVGTSTMNKQENYQILQDRTTCGGNRNVLNLPTLSNSGNNFQVDLADVSKQMAAFHGFAKMAPERSSIQGNLPFTTNFCVGNGEIYFYKGKKTFDSWYNMGAQDYVPTYRWLISQKGDMKAVTTDPIDVRFTHEDAYIGGSSIRLKGKADASDLVIYKTDLNVQGALKATVAVKSRTAGPSHLSLILQLSDGSWVATPIGDLSSTSWEEKELAISGVAAGSKIKHIGVRVEGADENYLLNLGQITLDDGTGAATPASIDESSVETEVKEETNKHLSVRMTWDVNSTGYDCPMKDRGMVFNDEVNIDHFEMLLKNGEDGKAYEVGRTNTWHAYFGKIDLEQFPTPYVGVRAISTDLKTASPVVWVKINRYADQSALPQESEATEGEPTYPEVYMDMSSDGLTNAFKYRWIEELKTTGATGDLDYTRYEPAGDYDDATSTPATGNTNYVYADNYLLTVNQGETVKFHIRGHQGTDDIRYCLFKAWMDWNGDGNFNSDEDSDEVVWEFGIKNHGASTVNDGGTTREKFVTEGVDFEVSVPSDATPGKSRLRIVACDAWFSGKLNASGGFNKGYALDIPVMITGTNAGRGVETTYADYRDEGDAEEIDLTGVRDITFDDNDGNVGVFNNGDNTISFNNVERAWIYNTAGQMVKHVAKVNGNVSINDLANGVYIVRMQNGKVLRSAKLIKK